MAKANKVLDQEDTPAKEEGGSSNNSDKTRNVSVGITSLTDKLKLLAKNSVADDDDVFAREKGKGPGVPDNSHKVKQDRIHSGSNLVGAQKDGGGAGDSACAGNGNDTGTGTGTGKTGSNSNFREKKFPPAYYNVRKLRANSNPVVELQSVSSRLKAPNKSLFKNTNVEIDNFNRIGQAISLWNLYVQI
jgi:hypothetical protein